VFTVHEPLGIPARFFGEQNKTKQKYQRNIDEKESNGKKTLPARSYRVVTSVSAMLLFSSSVIIFS